MSKWKKINQSDISFTENILHKTQNLDSSSADVRVLPYLSGSVSSSAYASPPTDSGSLYTFLESTVYLSGSKYVNSLVDSYEKQKLSDLQHSLRYTDEVRPQHINKFFDSGSVLSIPRKYYEDEIKATTFELTDNSHPSGTVTIRDDGWGNLYPVNNTVSQSTNSPSSSDNYVGNIFYEHGLVILTETGSYDDDITYLDVLTGPFTFKFKSTRRVYTREIIATVEPSEFNFTNNSTVRGFPTQSGIVEISKSPWFLPQFTSSIFQPYVTSIDLYDSKTTGPVARAKLAQPIQIRNDMPISFKLKLDM